MTMPSLSLLDGMGAIFDRWLAVAPIGKPPYDQHRQAALALSADRWGRSALLRPAGVCID